MPRILRILESGFCSYCIDEIRTADGEFDALDWLVDLDAEVDVPAELRRVVLAHFFRESLICIRCDLQLFSYHLSLGNPIFQVLLTWNLSLPSPSPPPVKLLESMVVTAVMLSYTESYLNTTVKPDFLNRIS